MTAAEKQFVEALRELFDREQCPFGSLAHFSDVQVLSFARRLSFFDYPGKMNAEQYALEIEKALGLTELDFN
jgi:hypothetical protein